MGQTVPSFARDAAAYSIERVVRLVVGGVTSIIVARHLGTESYGVLAYVLATFGLLIPLSTLGMPSVLVRDFVTRARWQQPYASALACQIPVAAAVGSLGAIALLWLSRDNPDATSAILVLCVLPLLSTAATARSWLEASHAAIPVVAVGVSASLIGGGLRILGVVADRGLTWFALANTLEAAIVFVGLNASVARRSSDRPRWSDTTRAEARRLLRESFPLLIGGFAVAVYMMIDTIMLGLLRSDADAGIYGAAVRLSEAWYFVPLAVMSAARPRLSVALTGGIPVYRGQTGRVLRLLAGVAYLGGIATILLADNAIETLFGADYSESVIVLQVHVLAAPFVFLGTGASQAFVDLGLTRIVMWRSIAGAAANVLLNLWLIPRYGPIGAATATVISYALAGVALNAVDASTRWIFIQQLRALALLPSRSA